MIVMGINAYHANASAANYLRPLKGELILAKINVDKTILKKVFY